MAPLGIEELDVEEDGIVYGRHQLDDFAIYRGEPPTTAAHVAFDAAERGAVDSFFEAAIAAGGRERGEPAVWASYSDRYYAAFVDDLHGNNVEAVFHSPEPVTDAPVRSDIP